MNLTNIDNKDQTLSLLVDYCRKRSGTLGGNGYDEIVLYYNNEINEFELHTYQKYDFMKDENHHVYVSSLEQYNSIMKKIEDNHLKDYENVKGHGLCGGDYVCKFMYDGHMIRITTANLKNESPNIIIDIGNLMRTFINDENEK